MKMTKIEIDKDRMTTEQWNKIDKVLRKHCPFKAIRWIEDNPE